MAPSFLLLHITNEKTLKFTQIGRLLSASRASPQKHVPTTLAGIPVDIYTLPESTCIECWLVHHNGTSSEGPTKEHLLIEQQLSSKHRGQKICRGSI